MAKHGVDELGVEKNGVAKRNVAKHGMAENGVTELEVGQKMRERAEKPEKGAGGVVRVMKAAG